MPRFNGYCLKEESISFNPPPLLQEGGEKLFWMNFMLDGNEIENLGSIPINP